MHLHKIFNRAAMVTVISASTLAIFAINRPVFADDSNIVPSSQPSSPFIFNPKPQQSASGLAEDPDVKRLIAIAQRLAKASNTYPGSTLNHAVFNLQKMVIEISTKTEISAWYAPQYPAEFPNLGITRMFLELLNDNQLAAVLAHEYGHWEVAAKEGEFIAIDNLHNIDRFGTIKFTDGTEMALSANERNADLSAIRRLYEAGYPPESLVLAFKKITDIIGSDTPRRIPLTPYSRKNLLGIPEPHGWWLYRAVQAMHTLTAFCETVNQSSDLTPCPASTMELIESWKAVGEEDKKGKAWAYQGSAHWFERLDSETGKLEPAPRTSLPVAPKALLNKSP
ncbi:MAG: M48 family metalloprotease [Alphaproteobacteria bacterium]